MEPLFDADLETAMASEAIFDHARFATYGITSDHFASEGPRRLVEAAEELWRETGEVGLENVAVLLRRDGKLDFFGGLGELSELVTVLRAPADPVRLRQLAALRRVRDEAIKAVTACNRLDLAGAIAALADGQSKAIDTSELGKVKTAYEVVTGALESFVSATKQERIHPGFEPLFDAVGPLPVGSSTIIIGNTNVSKSTTTLEMLMAASMRNVGAGLISVEDPDDITGFRVLSAKSGIDARDIHRGRIDNQQWSTISNAIEQLRISKETLLFADCTGGTEVDVCAAMSRMASRGARLVAVDYIGEVECSKEKQDRRNEIRYVVRRLKAHAKRLRVALVLVSQITRPADKNPNKPPSKHDIKECGDLENGAECIIGLWREEEHDLAPVRARILKSKIGGNGVEWMMQRAKKDGRLRVVSPSEVEPWR